MCARVSTTDAGGSGSVWSQDFPQLFALGLVLGTLYTRTRNLMTPIMVHGMWNGGVLVLLLVLQSAGYDVNEVLKGN